MKNLMRILCASAFLLGSVGVAQAQNLSASNTTTGTGTLDHISTISFTPGADSGSFDFILTWTAALMSTGTGNPAPDVVANIPGGTASCAVIANGSISCIVNANSSAVDLGAGTITIAFDIGATAGNSPLTFGTTNFLSQLGTAEPGTTTAGSVTIQAVAAPTVAFTPAAPGPIAFGPGGLGTPATPLPITIDGTGGTAGTSVSVACSFQAGAGTGLSVTGGPFTVNAPGTVGTDGTFNVGCTYQAAAQTGTLRCISTPSTGSPVNTDFTVTCPIGGATPPSVAYAPAVGSTISFTGPAVPIAQTITVSQTAPGTGGSVTVGPCVAPAGFTATGGPIVFTGGQPNPGGTIQLSCTAFGSTGSLSCPEITNDGVNPPATVQRTWNLNCPTASPEISTTPASGSTVNLTGAPGSTGSATIGIQNTGFAALTVTGCTITGAGAASFGAPTVSGGGTIAAGGTGSISLTCTAPAAGGTSVAASLSCTTNDADEGTITFPLSCTSILLSIPTLGLMGKGLMALLVLGLGLVGFGLHRRFA